MCLPGTVEKVGKRFEEEGAPRISRRAALGAGADITAIGVDTLSLDVGESTTFDVHVTLLGADKYGLENLANLPLIPPRGARVFVGVIPWEEGSGGPCRVIARY